MWAVGKADEKVAESGILKVDLRGKTLAGMREYMMVNPTADNLEC